MLFVVMLVTVTEVGAPGGMLVALVVTVSTDEIGLVPILFEALMARS